MSMHRRTALLAAVAPFVARPLARPALAQTLRYPERPIEIVVGFVAGGGTDLDARSYGRALEQRLGGTVVISNRPGAGGELALGVVARAKPDGHTIGTTNYPGLLTIPIERQAQFKLADFAPLANIVTDPSAITALAGGRFNSLAQVIEQARKAPDTITYASPGIGTDDHLQLVLLERAAGVRITHVAYQGDPQLRTALLGGQVDLMGLNLGAVTAAPDKMLMLSQAAATRSLFQPDVPTLKELGYDVEMASERGLVVPAGTPPAILAKLREATEDICRDAEFIRQLESRFTVPAYEAGEAWFARLRGEEERYRKIWQATPWRQ